MVRRAGSWLLLVFAWSWGVAALFAATGHTAEGYWTLAIGVPFLMGPLLASLAWKRWVVREPLNTLDAALKMNGLLIAAWLAPVALVWAAAGVAHLLGWGVFDLSGAPIVERVAELRGPEAAEEVRKGLEASRTPYAALATLQALVVGVLVYTPLAFAQEIGWRGVLSRELRPLGLWPSSVLIGIGWGVWIAPMALLGLFFPGDPVRGAVALAGACIPLGALLNWIRVRSGTVWAACVAHGVLTAFSGFHELVLSGGEARATSAWGLAGGIVYLALAVGLFAWDRTRHAADVDANAA